MARGRESKEIVDRFLKEIGECSDFLQQMIPCIIPKSEEDSKILKDGMLAFRQLDQFIKECDGSLSELDEVFNIDKIVEEYPKIEDLFKKANNSNSYHSDAVEEYMDDDVGDDDDGD